MEHLTCDVLVVGSGAAGLRAAIAAREKGLEVCVISKGLPGMGTCTILSGGAFAGSVDEKSLETHRARTLQAGRGINQRELVDVLVQEGPLRLKELMDWGIRGEVRKGHLFCEGRPAVWGEGIIKCLLGKARYMGVQFMGGLVVGGLRTHIGMVGVVAYSSVRGSWLAFTAKALVLAMGGAGALYLRHDNPQRMMGEGCALALEAGAVLQDMEFVQFYPLGLAEPGLPAFLIPPSLADFGRLYNGRGEDLLNKYDIQERPAAVRARDRLSQALFLEIQRDGQEVWLDFTEASDEAWEVDFLSASTREILGERYGARHRPIRVAPMAHHVMGGVRIDSQGGTSVPGMFAAGEITGGLHGANRMGGNALTETVVFGARAGEAASTWAEGFLGDVAMALLDELRAVVPRFPEGKPTPDLSQLKGRLREILWNEGGILRNKGGLERTLNGVKEILAELEGSSPGGEPRQMQQALELYLGCRTSALILEGGLSREESRGAHFREDFPEQDDDHWLGHLQVRLTPEGKEQWTFQPCGA